LIYTTKKIERVFSDDQFKLQELQIRFKCFQECFAMVQVMMSLWSLFTEFLGSYSRCRVSNGVMSRVLSPTNFYLKFWVNILTIRMLLCSSGWTSECGCVLHQNVDVHQTFIWVHHICMNTWISGFNICVSYDNLGNIH